MSWFIGLATLVGVTLTACGGTFVANSGDAGGGGSGTGGAGTGATPSSGGELGSGGAPSGGGTPGSGGGIVSSGGKIGSGGKAGSGGKTGAGGGRTVEPTNHRPEHVVCGTRPPSPPASDAGTPFQNCMTDAECKSGPNGKCTFGRVGPHCIYDACFNDGECGTGVVCACGSQSSSNQCLSPGCQIDADCPGSWCSPTFGSCGNYSGVVKYACHTSNDECTNDSDCNTGTPSAAYCMYDPTVAHWICSSSQCAG